MPLYKARVKECLAKGTHDSWAHPSLTFHVVTFHINHIMWPVMNKICDVCEVTNLITIRESEVEIDMYDFEQLSNKSLDMDSNRRRNRTRLTLC